MNRTRIDWADFSLNPVSAAWRKYRLEKPDECELDKP